jgi:hypothetical protein
MAVRETDRRVVEDLIKAMQIGKAAEQDLLRLFADDAVFVEPFTGRVQTHNGINAIRACVKEMWKTRAGDLSLTLDRVDLDGDVILAEWTCTSAMMPGPMQGVDRFEIAGGKIKRLEIAVTSMPQFGN